MRCDRCGYAVPDWLWIEGDHPIIIEEALPRITRTDNLETNTMKFVSERLVSVRMCSEVNHPTQEQEKLGEMADRLAAKSGLNYRCCMELLDKGWNYEERVNEPGRWVSPIANLKKE